MHEFGVCLNSLGSHSCTYPSFPYFLFIHQAFFSFVKNFQENANDKIHRLDEGGDKEVAYDKTAKVVMEAALEVEGPVNSGRKLTKDLIKKCKNMKVENFFPMKS